MLGAAFSAGFRRITAMTGSGNQPALRVLAKLEFSRTGEATFDGRRYELFVLEPQELETVA